MGWPGKGKEAGIFYAARRDEQSCPVRAEDLLQIYILAAEAGVSTRPPRTNCRVADVIIMN